MYCVNIFGAQGSGKSTTAAYVFSRLKMLGYSCELVTEVAKDLVWDGNRVGIETQLYVSGSQLYRLARLDGKVDIVVTDAPLLLQAVYYDINKCPNVKEFQDIEYESFMKYINLNYVLPCPKSFEDIGRVGYSDPNEKIHNMMIQLLNNYNVDYKCIVDRDLSTLELIVKDVMRTIRGDA